MLVSGFYKVPARKEAEPLRAYSVLNQIPFVDIQPVFFPT